MNNIKPYFWGPHYWKTIFSICASYPENPDSNFIRSIKEYMILLKMILPCELCRDSYIEYSAENDTKIDNDNNYTSKDNFIEFIYKLRNKINKKLGLEYNITLTYFKFKINNMICSKDSNTDAYAYMVMDAPFIQDSNKEDIYAYLSKNNYNNKYTKIIIDKLLEFYKNPTFDKNNNLFKLWFFRNSICEKIIKKIYYNMACYDYDINISFKNDYKKHLKLFFLGCSIIPSYNIKKLLENNN
jgi:hypothetical protein